MMPSCIAIATTISSSVLLMDSVAVLTERRSITLNNRNMGRTETPSVRLMTYGAQNLSNAELLSLVLWTGRHEVDLDVATKMLQGSNNSLVEFIKGIESNGDPINIQLLAAFELGNRKAQEEEISRLNAIVISNSRTIFAQFNQMMSSLDHEEMWVIYLSKNGKILLKKQIGVGGIDYTSADIRKIVKPALDFGASNVCMCHNHPHSTTRPSPEDRKLTIATKDALALFDVRLLDHLVISDGRYYSFADNGEI